MHFFRIHLSNKLDLGFQILSSFRAFSLTNCIESFVQYCWAHGFPVIINRTKSRLQPVIEAGSATTGFVASMALNITQL